MQRFLRKILIYLGFAPSYVTYIHSAEWQVVRKKTLERNPRCALCNRPKIVQQKKKLVVLHVHHRTYENLAREHDEDLTTLCEQCHKLFHDNYIYDARGFFIPKKKEVGSEKVNTTD